MLSLVLSYGLIYNLINVSISSVLLRDYQKIKGSINEYMCAFFLFAIIKAFIVLALSVGIGFFLYYQHKNSALVMVVAVNTASIILLYLTEPLTTLLSVEFRQFVLTKINFVASLANIAFSAGAILLPSALYVSAKNAVVALIVLILTARYTRKIFHLHITLFSENWLRLVKESFLGFSLIFAPDWDLFRHHLSCRHLDSRLAGYLFPDYGKLLTSPYR